MDCESESERRPPGEELGNRADGTGCLAGSWPLHRFEQLAEKLLEGPGGQAGLLAPPARRWPARSRPCREMEANQLNTLLDLAEKAGRIVVFSGSGLSATSGARACRLQPPPAAAFGRPHALQSITNIWSLLC